MSDDKNDKAGDWFGNPLPIVMVVLLAGGLLVKNVQLESARPTDSERIKFVPTELQDVEARLWQDPFAAVEKSKKSSETAITIPKNTLMMLFEPTSPNTSSTSHRLEDLKGKIKDSDNVTVVAVSVFGGPYAEDAESRRRSRFAVISALDFHDYHPVDNDKIGYFSPYPLKPEADSGKPIEHYADDVPYEWFEKEDRSQFVLVLWLKDEKLTSDPLITLEAMFYLLTPDSHKGLTVKFIGPAGSGTMSDLVGKSINQYPAWGYSSTIKIHSPSATISNCDLLNPEASQPVWGCFKNPPDLPNIKGLSLVRTTGTDDVLAAALLWEMWQRGVNRKSSPAHHCEDGLVLIGERDTKYGRTLLRYLNDGFLERCRVTLDGTYVTLLSDKLPVRTFSYLRGLDGVLADADKSSSKTPPKDDSGKSKDLREQLEDAPPEYAEGRNQFDYLRRLADEIDRLDDDKSFAEHGVKAIGLVGSDVYDKLLILQALHSRFKGKIFFTTDLDARYLHADQKDWARNLVVASNFGLSLHPALQGSTLPFRDSYQTSTYLATLMALMALRDPPLDWTGKINKWLRPHIFEIGRTEAVHLASPSVKRLTCWENSSYSEDSSKYSDCMKSSEKPEISNGNEKNYSETGVSPETETTCNGSWVECTSIEPTWPPRELALEQLLKILSILGLGILLVALANRRVNETVRAACAASSPKRDAARAILYVVICTVVVVFMILAIVWTLMDRSLAQGIGEPFRWLEGISVWPSLVIRFVGLVTMLALWYAFLKMIQQKEKPYKDFEIALPKIRKLNRSKMSAWLNGPHLNLALFDKESNAEANSAVKEERTGKKIIDVTTLWQNYLLATSWREMAGWIVASLLIGFVLVFAAFQGLGRPSFPHRGQLVETLHQILVGSNALVLWSVIFWVGYETRACARFIETLSNARSLWSPVLLDREEASTGVPRAHLDDYLDFRLIVRATQRIHWLIYLPFVSILFMVLSRSNFFDAMDFPLTLVFVVGLALAYALHSAWLLRRSAESARDKAIEHYGRRLLIQARVKDSQPPILIVDPISVEQIKLLMERIRNNREGAFAPFAQQPALQALLLPFGGYGSIQIIEYLFKL